MVCADVRKVFYFDSLIRLKTPCLGLDFLQKQRVLIAHPGGWAICLVFMQIKIRRLMYRCSKTSLGQKSCSVSKRNRSVIFI